MEALELFNEKVIKKQNKTGNNKMFFSVVLRKVVLLFSEMSEPVQPDLFILERVSWDEFPAWEISAQLVSLSQSFGKVKSKWKWSYTEKSKASLSIGSAPCLV